MHALRDPITGLRRDAKHAANLAKGPHGGHVVGLEEALQNPPPQANLACAVQTAPACEDAQDGEEAGQQAPDDRADEEAEEQGQCDEDHHLRPSEGALQVELGCYASQQLRQNALLRSRAALQQRRSTLGNNHARA